MSVIFRIAVLAFVCVWGGTLVSCGHKIDPRSDHYVSVTGVDISVTSRTLVIGQTLQLEATVRPSKADNKDIYWSCSPDSVASVGSHGLVTALKEGKCKVTATSADNGTKSASCDITVVKEVVPVTGVSFVDDEVVVAVGYGNIAKVELTPANTTEGKCVFEMEDESVATVSESGFVTGVSEGSTVLTVTTANGQFSDTIPVKVVQPYTKISLVSPSVSDSNYDSKNKCFDFAEGESFQIRLKTEPENADDEILYSSTAPSAVKVNEAGLVTVLHRPEFPYRATITATTAALGYSVSFTVYVTPRAEKLVLCGIQNSVGFDVQASRETGSECIGSGATQTWFIKPYPSTAIMSSAEIVAHTGSVQFSIKSSGTSDGDIFYLVATLPATTDVCFDTGRGYRSTVTVKGAGVSTTFTFYHTKWDPYKAKPGDGLYSSAGGSYVSFYDSGARGNYVYENSLSSISNRSKVFAIIGYIGDEHLGEDPTLTSSSYNKNGTHGIAIPSNADRLYVNKNPDSSYASGYADNTGCIFSEDSDNLETSGYSKLSDKTLLGYNSNKHSAKANTEDLYYYNSKRGTSHEVIPIHFVRDSDESGSIYTTMERWDYDGNAYDLNHRPVSAYSNLAGHSRWCIPTKADLADVFVGGEKVNFKVHLFLNSLNLFNSGSSESFSYRYTYWLSQQYDSKNGAAVTITPSASDDANYKFLPGKWECVSQSKGKSTKNYILPVLYF